MSHLAEFEGQAAVSSPGSHGADRWNLSCRSGLLSSRQVLLSDRLQYAGADRCLDLHRQEPETEDRCPAGGSSFVNDLA